MFITDRRLAAGPLIATVAAAFEAGLRWVSLREKDLHRRDRTELARELVILGRRFDATVTVHADLDAAREAGAAGIHLPRTREPGNARDVLGPGALVGMSAHGLEEVEWACEREVDYITLSPVFPSISKPGYRTADGLSDLTEAASTSLHPSWPSGASHPSGSAPVWRPAHRPWQRRGRS